jgi:Holliday junction resolvase
MAATPESRVKKQIRKILDTTRTYYAMPIGTGYGSSGVPDFLACHEGHFIGIEAKAGKGKTTALQEDNMRRIRESGGTTIVVNEDNLNELEGMLCKKDER